MTAPPIGKLSEMEVITMCFSCHLILFQVSESSTKDHMDKWTELEEKCARMIGHTKELETRSRNEHHTLQNTCAIAHAESRVSNKLRHGVDVISAYA